MLLNRIARHQTLHRLACRTNTRMVVTLAGKTGRVYIQGEVIQHRHDRNLTIYKAESGNRSFVLKRVPQQFYDVSMNVAAELAGSNNLRLQIDCNPEDGALIYPYFSTTLLALLKDDPTLDPEERAKILRSVGEAIKELHDKDWVHVDIKPDNIFVDWTSDSEGNKIVTNVALGDFDLSLKLGKGAQLRTRRAVGNPIWRSPEGQTGRGVTKASDIYSFGLVCLYIVGAGEFLIPENYRDLHKQGVTPEQEILARHFTYFGPVPDGLLKRIDSEHWSVILEAASYIAEETIKDQPQLRFTDWGTELGPDLADLISGMTRLDPADRLTIDQVMAHPMWQQL